MKPISLPVAELRPALAGFSKVIAKRSTLAVLGCIQVRRHESGHIDLTVTDLDQFATYRLGAQDHPVPADILVPFEDLNNVVKSCSAADIITLERSDAAASIRFPVAGQPVEHRCEVPLAEQFPTLLDLRGKGIRLPSTFRTAIVEALECASSDHTRFILNGAFIDVSEEEGHYVVGTDGRHLFSSNSFSLPMTQSLVIPTHKFLTWKGFHQDGDWTLKEPPADEAGTPRFEISSSHWRFVARVIDGKYPDWRAPIPSASAFQTSISIEPDKLVQFLQATMRLPTYEGTHMTVGIEVTEDGLRLLGKTKPEMEWSKIEIGEAAAEGPPLTIFLDKRLLLKALRFGLTRIDMIDAVSPVRFSRGGRQMIVMPLGGIAPAASPNPAPDTSPRGIRAEQAPSSSPPAQQSEPNHPPVTPHTTNGHRHHSGANGSTNTPATSPPKEEPKSALETALAQIEALKAGFRESTNSLSKIGDSVRLAMREQRASDKEVQNVRQTLRSLQGVRL